MHYEQQYIIVYFHIKLLNIYIFKRGRHHILKCLRLVRKLLDSEGLIHMRTEFFEH